MARIAIVHIPHDEDAETLMSSEIEWPGGSRLVGVFNYPNRPDLTCPGTCTGRGARAHSVRDDDDAMICSSCGGKTVKIRELLMGAIRDYLGHNLFPRAPKAFKTPRADNG